MKTFIEIKLEPEQTRIKYIQQYSLRGKIGFLFLWLIGVISFNK
jgi:hypothetical protein